MKVGIYARVSTQEQQTLLEMKRVIEALGFQLPYCLLVIFSLVTGLATHISNFTESSFESIFFD